ncbi:MAG: hemin uptake protein HemP [Rhodobacterales bacterium]|nr:hemin uptake protein HemP [Rhodobacterales bacterium]
MNARPDPQTLTPAPTALPRDEGWPLHDALRLTQGGTQARIVLNGQVYALRITRAGKLILTK